MLIPEAFREYMIPQIVWDTRQLKTHQLVTVQDLGIMMIHSFITDHIVLGLYFFTFFSSYEVDDN